MNYKIGVAIIALCFVALDVLAQDDNWRLTISGELVDADLKEPMAQATMQLFTASDSKFVGSTVIDEKGNSSVEAPSNGIYRLNIFGGKKDTEGRYDKKCPKFAIMNPRRTMTLPPYQTAAAIWPSWARYVLNDRTDGDAVHAVRLSRFVRFAVNVIDVPNDFTDPEDTALRGIEAMERFYHAIGMPVNIKELIGKDITDDEIKEMTRKCSRNYTSTCGSLKVLKAEDMEAIYNMARG